MAYNLRLTIEGSDILENNVAIKVYQEGFTGEAVTRNGAGNVLEISWGSKSGELLPVVYGSEATVRFFAENDYEFLDLFATNARDLKVEIILNETDTIWAGFIEPEKWSEPLISPNYEVQFTAYDGLGLLKDEDFAAEDKTPYEGEATPLEILQLILSKTGLELPLNTKVNIRPSTAITAIDSLTQTRINQSSYTGQTCYEVLESLFLNCRLKQRGGEWYIISHDEWSAAATTITWYSYTAAGAANGTKQTDKYFTGFWFENQASLEIMPAVKQLQITHNYGYKQNLLLNGDFQEFNAATGFDAWTVVGGFTPQQRQYDPDGNKFVYLPGIERLDPWDSANRTKYMVSEAITVSQASDVFNIHLDYALMGPVKNSGYVFFGAFLEGDNGIDYALEAYYYTETDIREVRYRWTANSHKLAVPVKAHIKRNRVFLGADTFEVEPDRIEAYPYDDVMNHFATAQIAVEGGIPTSGTLQIYLFLAHTGGTVAGNCFRKIRLFLTDEEGEEFPTQTDYTLINSLRNNYVPQETTVFNGDLPPLDNALTIYTTGFIHNGGLTDGDPTTLWKLDTAAAVYTWVELMARMMASELRIPKQSYQVRLGDTTPGTAMLFEDEDNPGKIFIEAGVKYDFRMATTEGRYVELIPINLSPYTLVENAETTGGTTGGTTRPTPGENLNTDERSKLIDPVTYDIEGQAGYLSSEDFEQEIDETTGRAVNSIRYHKAQIFDPTAPGFAGAPGFLSAEDFTFEVDPVSGFTIIKNIGDEEIELRESNGWVEWRYVGDATWIQLYEIPTSGAINTFTGLTDTPADYTGAAAKKVVVNAAETALEFVDDPNYTNWKLNSSEQIIGYLTEPANIAVNVDGTGSISESVAAGDVVVTAINANGETTPADVPAFDVLADSTQAIISWDAVEGATAYRVYDAGTGNYTETTSLTIDYLTFNPATAGSVPTENTAAIYQTPTEIENGDTVDIVGEGIEVETKVDEGDSTRKEVKLIKQQSDWNEADTESPNFIKGKPEIPINTDEKLKFDVDDPAAGYLSEKIIAGTNITIEEGTGADENKLKINSTASGGFDVYIDFLDTTAFVYNCPAALKFTQVISESTAPTLSVALNTNMAQFDKLTVTPAAVGLVILKGELL